MQDSLDNKNDNELLSEFERLLNQDAFLEEISLKELEDHCLALSSDEQLSSQLFQQMQGKELALFRSQPDYQRWYSSKEQCLLILSGHNHYSIESMSQCWISPVATALIRDFKKDGSVTYAYSILPRQGKLFCDVLQPVIFQLLKKKITALRDGWRLRELRSELKKFHKCTKTSIIDEDCEAQKLALLEKIALRVVNLFDESESVYVIVDSIDRCRQLKPPTIDHRKMLLKCLLKLVDGGTCRLKVLAVIDGQIWPQKRYNDMTESRIEGRVIIHEAKQKSVVD